VGDSDLLTLVLTASPVVQAVMLILLIMSISAWAIGLERLKFMKDQEKLTKAFEIQFWNAPELNNLYNELKKEGIPQKGAERIFCNGLAEYHKLMSRGDLARSDVLAGVERTMRITFSQEVEKLEARLSILATIGSSAPYIGLFGTVWGVMHAFQSLGNIENATLAAVAPGISEALIATAIGLFAAIPAVIAFNRLSARANRVIGYYENFADGLITSLQRNDRLSNH
jgi:biopolymer transport protein TolQ